MLFSSLAAKVIRNPILESRTKEEVCNKYGQLFTYISKGNCWRNVTNKFDCDPGAQTDEDIIDTKNRINLYRYLAGLEPEVYDPTYHERQMKGACISRYNGLNHNPSSSATCYTSEGAGATSTSNLASGAGCTSYSIDMYMQDYGQEELGHRRWVLYSIQSAFSVGLTSFASALKVFGASSSETPIKWNANDRPRYFITFPPPGPCPITMMKRTYSFVPESGKSVADDTKITITRGDGLNISATNFVSKTGYGDLAFCSESSYYSFKEGQSYHFRVHSDSQDYTYEWTTTVINCNTYCIGSSKDSKDYCPLGIGKIEEGKKIEDIISEVNQRINSGDHYGNPEFRLLDKSKENHFNISSSSLSGKNISAKYPYQKITIYNMGSFSTMSLVNLSITVTETFNSRGRQQYASYPITWSGSPFIQNCMFFSNETDYSYIKYKQAKLTSGLLTIDVFSLSSFQGGVNTTNMTVWDDSDQVWVHFDDTCNITMKSSARSNSSISFSKEFYKTLQFHFGGSRATITTDKDCRFNTSIPIPITISGKDFELDVYGDQDLFNQIYKVSSDTNDYITILYLKKCPWWLITLICLAVALYIGAIVFIIFFYQGGITSSEDRDNGVVNQSVV